MLWVRCLQDRGTLSPVRHQINQEDREGSNGFKTKITKKDSMSAFHLRDKDNLSPYMVTGVNDT